VGSDETPEFGPEVPGIVDSFSLAGGAERLTRATAGPHGAVVGHSSEAQRERPAADAGEEMALVESNEVIWRHLAD
jgi:hypothetical protein